MRTRMNIIFVAGIALTGAALLSSPSQAQVGAGATPGVPNVTAPTDSVRQGAAGINSAQAEATRTTGNAEQDARATAENAEAGVGDPTISGNASTTISGNASTQTTIAANSGGKKSATARNSSEREITRELNRQQAANSSGDVTMR